MINFKDLDFLVEKLREVDDEKRHIFITGDIKVGKTTLLNYYLKKYYEKYTIDGIRTELVITDKFRIMLSRYNSHDRIVIGERNVFGMNFYSDLFVEKSFEIFDDLKEDLDILILDEVGNNELKLVKYTGRLLKVLEKYRTFAVLKKCGNPIFENIEKISEYVIFDLDKFYE